MQGFSYSEERGRDTKPGLHTSEGIPYGKISRKFHGPNWEEVVVDYGFRPHDSLIVGLDNFGMFLDVDIYQCAILLLPLPWVGKLLVFLCIFYQQTTGLSHVSTFPFCILCSS